MNNESAQVPVNEEVASGPYSQGEGEVSASRMEADLPTPLPVSDSSPKVMAGIVASLGSFLSSRHTLFTASAAMLRRSWNLKALTVLLLTLVVVSGVMFYEQNDTREAVRQFSNVYSFVPEKISKSALIPIHLPKGIDEELARKGITFSPDLEGEWVVEDLPDTIVFRPEEPLTEKVYYAVNMDVPGAQMSGDFYVDADPAVEAVFPANGSEVDEKSEITIVFNRPMVPLTTLDVTEGTELPITISPETKGRFKWISTRTLQFIPETTLVPSSLYTVTLDEGLTSVDGLKVSSFTHTFTSRPLRYTFISEGEIGYRAPITIAFNQEVDLEKTKDFIRVLNTEGKEVPVDVVYGKSTTYDWEHNRTIETEDPSILFVYLREDRHGRKHFWDFDAGYTLIIDGAKTPKGTVGLSEVRSARVHTPNIVESVKATSERTALARPEVFDPQGSLVVQFYDHIDIRKLEFDVPGYRDVRYAKQCKRDRDGNEIWKGNACEEEDDMRTLIFTFHEKAFTTGQIFTLDLKKVYTTDGQKINPDTYTIPLRVYPAFSITKTSPSAGDAAASLTELTVCSNSPLRDIGEDESVRSYVQTNGYVVFGPWYGSSYVDQTGSWYRGPCAIGEFETVINYGLLPETPYTIQLSLTDAFGQTASADRSFTTKAAESKNTHIFGLQPQYNVTRPDRTTLTFGAENLETINLHICKMTPETFLRRTVHAYEPSDAPSDSECIQTARDTISLPPRYWVNNYFQVDLEKYFADTRGQYVVTLSSPLYTEKIYDYYTRSNASVLPKERPLYERTLMSVTNLAVGKKEVVRYEESYWQRSTNPAMYTVLDTALANATNLYWVTDSASLLPLSGATVTQFTNRSDAVMQSTVAVTDTEGIARPKVASGVVGAVVRSGQDAAVVTNWSDMLSYAQGAESASRTYIFTDRPIYRPGQTVYIRGIDRIGFDGAYEVWAKDPVPLTVMDSLDAVVYDTELVMDGVYGTFSTSFEIPHDAPLGNYRITAFGQDTYISVEEYVPAAFKLEATTKQDEYVNGDTVTLGVQADYYFGVPLDGGTVSYTVTAQDYYFDRYKDEYFNFGGDWYFCYSCGYGDQYLFRGETVLNANGHADIRETFVLDEYFDAGETGSKLITISVTAKDRNGRSVSTQRSFVLHASEYYLGTRLSESYTSINTPITLRAKTVDTSGTPISRDGIERIVYKVEWETFKREEVDGGFYYRSEPKETEVSREEFSTDSAGNWSDTITLSQSGQYRVVVRGKDDRGNVVESSSYLYIYGGSTVYVPPNNNYELDLEVDRRNVSVGDTASMLIKSPYEYAKVLITAQRGTVYDHWIVEVRGGLYKHTFPVKEEYAPNINLSALLLSGDPEVKYGSVDFAVGTQKHTLNVSVESNKETYLPGESVTLVVHTTDGSGKSAPAEVSLAVADLSVLALRGNPKKDPLAFFYDGFPLSVTTASNIKNILYEADIPLGTKGGDGGDPEDLATKQRGEFKDTAYWNATVVTDVDGRGEVTFTLPDNLTTWRIEAIGVTGDTKLGVGYAEFSTQKELMATPLKPRFVVPGDTFALGAKVFNESDTRETVSVMLESDTLAFTGSQKESVSIDAGETKTVYFAVEAPKTKRTGTHTFTLTAESMRGKDSVRQEIAITPSTVYETVATAHFTKDDVATEYLYVPEEVVSDEGGLTVNVNATLAIFMSDALQYMAQYPYGCSEQIASALSTIAMVKRALDVPGVEGSLTTIEDVRGVPRTVDDVVATGLQRIYESQTGSGGIAYYKTLAPDIHLTMRVVLALHELRESGFEVREDVLKRAFAYIEEEAGNVYRFNPKTAPDTIVLAEYTLRTVGGKTETALTNIIEGYIKDKALLNEQMNSMTLAYLAILTAQGFSDRSSNTVYDALTNRIDVDGRGAYLTQPRDVVYGYYETTIANTTLLLRAMIARGDEHPMLGNVLRALLASRDRDGVWGSTQNTHMAVTALVQYLAWQHENEATFSLRALLNGVELFVERFSPENIFRTASHFIPMEKITKGTMLPLTFERTVEGEVRTNLYYDMALRYYLPAATVPPRDEGITIERELFALDDTEMKQPVTGAKVGDILRGRLMITTPDPYRDIAIEDFIPAGFEIVNQNLATEDQTLGEGEGQSDPYYDGYGFDTSSGESENNGFVARTVGRIRSIFGDSQSAQVASWYADGWYGNTSKTRTLRPSHIESHDDRVFLFVSRLDPGVYEYEYYIRALVPGEFQHLPAKAEELYFPEIFGRTSGGVVTVTED